jgi:phosphatidylglycerophosphatase A
MKRLLTSCFGLGWLPVAPGSWGSLPSAIIFGLACYFGGSAAIVISLMIALIVAGSVICVKFSNVAIAATGKHDPNEVVADEVAGQALTFVAMPLLIHSPSGHQLVAIVALGYFCFDCSTRSSPGHRIGSKSCPPAGGYSPTTLWRGCMLELL